MSLQIYIEDKLLHEQFFFIKDSWKSTTYASAHKLNIPIITKQLIPNLDNELIRVIINDSRDSEMCNPREDFHCLKEFEFYYADKSMKQRIQYASAKHNLRITILNQGDKICVIKIPSIDWFLERIDDDMRQFLNISQVGVLPPKRVLNKYRLRINQSVTLVCRIEIDECRAFLDGTGAIFTAVPRERTNGVVEVKFTRHK